MGTRNADAVRKVRRGDKLRWIIDFPFVDKSGVQRRYRRDAKVQSAEGARKEARQRQELAAEFGDPEGRPPSIGFSTFVTSVFTAQVLPRFRPSTRRRYEDLLRQWLTDHFRDRPLDRIGPADIQALAGKLAVANVQAKGAMSLLRTILRAAVSTGVLQTAPEVPRCWSDGKRLPDAPTEEDVSALVTGASGWFRLAIALAAYAGLRSGEVRALEARDVDLQGDRLLVRRAFSDKEVRTPKSGHERVVPIAEPLRLLLVDALRSKLPKARGRSRARRTPAGTRMAEASWRSSRSTQTPAPGSKRSSRSSGRSPTTSPTAT